MRPVPIRRYSVLAVVITVSCYIFYTPRYVANRQEEVNDSFAKLQAKNQAAATKVQEELADKGVPFPPTAAQSQWLSLDTINVVNRVNQVEAVVLAYNTALGRVPDHVWGDKKPTKADIDALRISGHEFPMVAGYEQAAGIAFILLASFVLCRLGADIRREYRDIKQHPELTRRDHGFVTPTMAATGANKLQNCFGRAQIDRERHSAFLIQTYHLLADFAHNGDASKCGRVLDGELNQISRLALARYAWINYVIFAVPTLKLLATLRGMAGGLDQATNPENLPTVVASIGAAFAATIVSLIILLPLMLWRYLLSARLARLEVVMQDEGEALIRRFRGRANANECSEHEFWREAQITPNDTPIPPAVNDLKPDVPRRSGIMTRWGNSWWSFWERVLAGIRIASNRLSRFSAAVWSRGVAVWHFVAQILQFTGESCFVLGSGLMSLAKTVQRWSSSAARFVSRIVAAGLGLIGDLFKWAAIRLGAPNNSPANRRPPTTTFADQIPKAR